MFLINLNKPKERERFSVDKKIHVLLCIIFYYYDVL